MPPHVMMVTPPDGTVLFEQGRISVKLDLQVGNGISSTSPPSLFIDGIRLNPHWTVEGDPPAVGYLRFDSPYAFSTGKHLLKVRYQDTKGQEFTYTWRVAALGERAPLDQLPPETRGKTHVSPEVLETIEIPVLASSTPLPCTSLPEGMVLRVEPLSPAEAQDESGDRSRDPLVPPSPPTRLPAGVRVEIEGLQPGERPRLIFHAKSGGYHHYEIQAAQPAGSDGRLTVKENRVRPLGGQETMWQIKVVHARGWRVLTLHYHDRLLYKQYRSFGPIYLVGYRSSSGDVLHFALGAVNTAPPDTIESVTVRGMEGTLVTTSS